MEEHYLYLVKSISIVATELNFVQEKILWVK